MLGSVGLSIQLLSSVRSPSMTKTAPSAFLIGSMIVLCLSVVLPPCVFVSTLKNVLVEADVVVRGVAVTARHRHETVKGRCFSKQ